MDYPIGWIPSSTKCFCEVPLTRPSKFASIEIQKIEHGGQCGYIAGLNHWNGRIDILFEQHLPLDRHWTSEEPAMSHMNVGHLEPMDFLEVHSSVTSNSVSCKALFNDLDGDAISFNVDYNNRGSLTPMATPAPPQTKPHYLRFLVIDSFHQLPQGSNIVVSINGRPQSVKPHLLPARLARYTGARAAGNLIQASLGLRDISQSTSFSSIANDALHYRKHDRWFKLLGLPTKTEIEAIDHGSSLTGNFYVDSHAGCLANGIYQIRRDEDHIDFRMQKIRQDWNPGWQSPTRAAMRIVRKIRRARENWNWVADIKLLQDGNWEVAGHWTN